MSIRETLQQKPAVAIGFATAAMVMSAAVYVLNTRGGDNVKVAEQYYYLDLKSGEVFAAPASDLPVDAPAGGAGQGVQAKVYSCGECDASQWRVAYVQSLTPTVQKFIRQGKPDAKDAEAVLAYGNALAEGLVVAEAPTAGAEPKWIPVGSPQGAALMSQYRKECGGAAIECLP